MSEVKIIDIKKTMIPLLVTARVVEKWSPAIFEEKPQSKAVIDD